jgi:hypothetical protein
MAMSSFVLESPLAEMALARVSELEKPFFQAMI